MRAGSAIEGRRVRSRRVRSLFLRVGALGKRAPAGGRSTKRIARFECSWMGEWQNLRVRSTFLVINRLIKNSSRAMGLKVALQFN
ncbi:hypothetical protein QT995_15165 [Microcoleus sp. S36b_A3]|uniref:hypothetical protein n=1 Tax=unclassified Microcoleus TaxID=2642155 RepID=UPI002FD3C554